MLSAFLALALCQAPQAVPAPPKPAATVPTCPGGKCPAAKPADAKKPAKKPHKKFRLFHHTK